MEAVEEGLGQIEIRQHQPIVQLEGDTLISCVLEKDLDVLLYARLSRCSQCALITGSYGIEVGFLPLYVVWFGVEDVRVVSLDAQGSRLLRMVFGKFLQKRRGLLVALDDPRRLRYRSGRCAGQCRGSDQ